MSEKSAVAWKYKDKTFPPDGDTVSKTNLPQQRFLISIDEGSSVCLE